MNEIKENVMGKLKMTVYISGKVSGDSNFREKFAIAEKALKGKHPVLKIKTVNPVKGEKEGKSWEYYLKKDIKKLLKCNAIYLLPDWRESKGALFEKEIAEKLGYTVIYA